MDSTPTLWTTSPPGHDIGLLEEEVSEELIVFLQLDNQTSSNLAIDLAAG